MNTPAIVLSSAYTEDDMRDTLARRLEQFLCEQPSDDEVHEAAEWAARHPEVSNDNLIEAMNESGLMELWGGRHVR